MRIDGNTPVSVLYHSEDIVYIDLAPDEICHHKYIKRVQLPNGKYRYFYTQAELDAEGIAAKGAGALLKESAKARYNAGRDMLKTYKDRNKSAKNAMAYTKAKVTYEAAKAVQKKTAAKSLKIVKDYQVKRVKSFAARTVSKGAVKVANWLSSKKRP